MYPPSGACIRKPWEWMRSPTEGVRREKKTKTKKKLRGTLTCRVQIQREKD